MTSAQEDSGRVTFFATQSDAVKNYSQRGYVVVADQGSTVKMVLKAKKAHPIWGKAPVSSVTIRS